MSLLDWMAGYCMTGWLDHLQLLLKLGEGFVLCRFGELKDLLMGCIILMTVGTLGAIVHG